MPGADERGYMGTTALRLGATVLACALGSVALGASGATALDTGSLDSGSLNTTALDTTALNTTAHTTPHLSLPTVSDLADNVRLALEDVATQEAAQQAAQEQVRHAREQLEVHVAAATASYESSAGKASDQARRDLAIERNRANSAIATVQHADQLRSADVALTEAQAHVDQEVAAWEQAEAERIAQEQREAEQRAAEQARAAGRRGSGSGSAGAASGDPRAYLEAAAAKWGISIQWADTACGTGSATVVGGCYSGGSTVTVTTSALRSWDVAKGRGRNVVLHEVGHALIMRTCGTVYVSDRYENVADAYAVLIGAGGGTGYGYNDADMALARAISNGSCSV